MPLHRHAAHIHGNGTGALHELRGFGQLVHHVLGILVHEAAIAQRSPESVLMDRSVSDDVQRALESLPDDFRVAVVLCDIEGLSYKEIADVMGTPVGTVMSRLFRGRRLLQASLKDFAIQAGYVKPEPSDGDGHDQDEKPGDPIDLTRYRASKRTPTP